MNVRSGRTGRSKDISVWMATTPASNYPSLSTDTKTDAVVIGGGIAGIHVAILLKQKGLKVILVEAGRIVEETTGNTTAKLTSLHGLKYARLLQAFDASGVRMYADANQAAIRCAEKLVGEYRIACDCISTNAYTYAVSDKDRQLIENEVDSAKRLGLPATFVSKVPLPFQTFGAVMFTEQMQFHVRKYLLGIAAALDGNNSHIYEHTKALDVRQVGGGYRVVTDKGDVSTSHVVITTKKPFYDPDGTYTGMAAFRDYALGVLIDGPIPEGMYFSTGDDPYSIRCQPTGEDDIVILGGGWHEEGKPADVEKRFESQRLRYSKLFPVKEVRYRWYAHDYGLDDQVPSIGTLSKKLPNVHLATAFGGWGMTTGVVAGMIISDLIAKKENPWSSFFDYFERTPFRRTGT